MNRESFRIGSTGPPYPVYTIGHSTRSILQFVELLQIGKIETVVDIRSTPRSRTNPQFNFDALPQALTAWNIGYTQIVELGGRRRKSTTISPDVNAFWTHQSFHNYADHALSDEFNSGLTRLLELSAAQSCAQKRSGGAAIAGSSPTTSCTTAEAFCI